MRKEGGRRTKIKIPLDFPRVLRNEFWNHSATLKWNRILRDYEGYFIASKSIGKFFWIVIEGEKYDENAQGMATGVVVCPIESCFVLSAVARARRINMRTKFPGNKKEAAAVDAKRRRRQSAYATRFVPIFLRRSGSARSLFRASRTQTRARACIRVRNTRNADGWREREADFVEF